MDTCEFTLQDLVPIAIVFVVCTIVLSYGAVILTNVGTNALSSSTQTATCNATSGVATGCGYNYNITTQGNSGLWNIANNIPLMATIVVASVIIGILVVYLGRRLMGG